MNRCKSFRRAHAARLKNSLLCFKWFGVSHPCGHYTAKKRISQAAAVSDPRL